MVVPQRTGECKYKISIFFSNNMV
uniref:Uncharacterized protein n=1 Tax=Arundo donax TaxID=35708 RepID=A0A0A9F315_ARUDO